MDQIEIVKTLKLLCENRNMTAKITFADNEDEWQDIRFDQNAGLYYGKPCVSTATFDGIQEAMEEFEINPALIVRITIID